MNITNLLSSIFLLLFLMGVIFILISGSAVAYNLIIQGLQSSSKTSTVQHLLGAGLLISTIIGLVVLLFGFLI